jgi:hypothetical protein
MKVTEFMDLTQFLSLCEEELAGQTLIKLLIEILFDNNRSSLDNSLSPWLKTEDKCGIGISYITTTGNRRLSNAVNQLCNGEKYIAAVQSVPSVDRERMCFFWGGDY